MKRLQSVENHQVELEVVECDCGFHMGVDASYLNQIGDFKMICPACKLIWDTAEILKE